jgi:hypothetical protein
MKQFVLALLIVCSLSGYASAAILVMSPSGTYTTKTDLATAATAADAAGKTIVVTSALSAVQSNISSASLHAWPTDRALRIEKGGSIANTTAFVMAGPFSAGLYPVFVGSGTLTGLKEAHPEWFGAIAGDDIANEDTNVTAFNNTSKAATKVIVAAGIYRFNDSWWLANYQHVVGVTLEIGTAGNTSVGTDLRFNMNSGVAIRAGIAPLIEKLKITCIGSNATYTDATFTYGTATANGLQLVQGGGASEATLRDVQFYLWHHAVVFGDSTYYFKSYNVEFNRCNFGYYSGGLSPYNVHIDSPRSALTNVFISGRDNFGAINNIKIIGGSIEGFKELAQLYRSISVFGTYIETRNTVNVVNAFNPILDYAVTNLFGALIYLDNMVSVVNYLGYAGCSLTASGNEFRGYTAAADNTVVYNLSSTGVGMANTNLQGDTFGTSSPVRDTVRYINNSTFHLNGIIQHPVVPSTNTDFQESGRTLIGKNSGFSVVSRTSAPNTTGNPAGGIYQADGIIWDPLALTGGRPYYVLWQGDRWRSVSGQSLAPLAANPDTSGATLPNLEIEVNQLKASLRTWGILTP